MFRENQLVHGHQRSRSLTQDPRQHDGWLLLAVAVGPELGPAPGGGAGDAVRRRRAFALVPGADPASEPRGARGQRAKDLYGGPAARDRVGHARGPLLLPRPAERAPRWALHPLGLRLGHLRAQPALRHHRPLDSPCARIQGAVVLVGAFPDVVADGHARGTRPRRGLALHPLLASDRCAGALSRGHGDGLPASAQPDGRERGAVALLLLRHLLGLPLRPVLRQERHGPCGDESAVAAHHFDHPAHVPQGLLPPGHGRHHPARPLPGLPVPIRLQPPPVDLLGLHRLLPCGSDFVRVRIRVDLRHAHPPPDRPTRPPLSCAQHHGAHGGHGAHQKGIHAAVAWLGLAGDDRHGRGGARARRPRGRRRLQKSAERSLRARQPRRPRQRRGPRQHRRQVHHRRRKRRRRRPPHAVRATPVPPPVALSIPCCIDHHYHHHLHRRLLHLQIHTTSIFIACSRQATFVVERMYIFSESS